MASILVPTLSFNEITKSDYPKVGLKGANIGELVAAKVPVPYGFAVSSEAYFYFLDMARIREKIVDILSDLDVENAKELEEASNVIQDMIIKSSIPPVVENAILKAYSRLSGFVNTYVAVRSSIAFDDEPDDSFAGMSSTFLNIKGTKDILLATKACWASLFEPNSIYYRATKGISHMKVGMAVVIQKMVQAEVSGVMLTINPLTEDNSKIIIESVLGLGDIIAADAITPDHYELQKADLQIDVKKASKQTHMIIRSAKRKEDEEQIKKVPVAQRWQQAQKLDDRKIQELGSIGKLIEQHFGEPQDIEWAMEAGKLYILQARSIVREKTAPSKVQEEVNQMLPEEIKEAATPVMPETVQAATEPEQVQEFSPIEEIQEKTVQEEITLPDAQILLSGSPASEGIVEGKVVVVKENDDFIHLNTGDILVIEKIIPDYILWMRKAGGIITNEGGMTSHAAILSREFHIPCIVGTENATEMLRTGDVVVINGSTGRVYAKEMQQPDIAPATPLPEETPVVNEDVSAWEEVHEEAQVAPEIPVETPSVEEQQNLPEEITDYQPTVLQAAQVMYEREMEPVEAPSKGKEVVYPKSIKTATKVMINLSNSEYSASLCEKDSDGIGYINGTEVLNSIIKRHPESFIEEESVEKYVHDIASVLEVFCKDFNPRPVIYRPSNLVTSELNFDASKYEGSEKNPKLGYNGAIKYIQNPSLFNLEIEAIKIARNKFGYKNLWLMLPMVRDAKDLREIKKIVTSNDLKRSSTFKIFLPIEAPSSAIVLDELIDIGVDGVFIFTKTYSSLLNAVDLENPKYKNFNIFNEAFMQSAEHIIKLAHHKKIPAGLVLEGGEFDEMALKEIIEWGAIYLSVDPYHIEKTKFEVANIEKSLILSRRR